MRYGPIACQSCRWNKYSSPGQAWSLLRSSPNIKGGDRTPLPQILQRRAGQQANGLMPILRRPSARMRIYRSPVPSGTKWLAKWQNRPTHRHQRRLASHPQLGHHGQIGVALLYRFGLPIRRIREACGWDSAYCCQPIRQILSTGSPPITNSPVQQVSAG